MDHIKPPPDEEKPGAVTRPGDRNLEETIPAPSEIVNACAYKVHPVAALFPLLEKGTRAYNDLDESIRLFGQLDPIVIDGNVLLDGRNRLAICEDLGIAPKVVEWSSLGIKNPQHEWIFGKNAARRNLTREQLGAIYVAYNAWTTEEDAKTAKQASQFAPGISANPGGKPKSEVTQKSGTPEKSTKRDHKAKHANSTAGKVAAATGLSRYKAEQTIAIANADPALLDQVASGSVPLKDAVKQVRAKRPPKPKREKQDNDPPHIKIATEVLAINTVEEESHSWSAEIAASADEQKARLSTLKKFWAGCGPETKAKFRKWAGLRCA